MTPRSPARLAFATTTTATVTTAAAAPATTTAAASIFARARFVDAQVAPVKFFAVKLRDGGFSFFFGPHLDEPKAARTSRVTIHDDRSRLYRPDLPEQFLQIFTGSLEIEIADVKFY